MCNFELAEANTTYEKFYFRKFLLFAVFVLKNSWNSNSISRIKKICLPSYINTIGFETECTIFFPLASDPITKSVLACFWKP